MEEVYVISKKEINRRINAYTALIIFFFVSLIFFSFNYVVNYLNISIYIILTIVFFLYLSRIILIRYFNSILKTDIKLNSEYIRKNNIKYLTKNIRKIIIKRTTKGYVREIKIILNKNIITYINNSTNDIENFLTKLKKYVPEETTIKTINEPLDFDHIVFYPILGTLVGFISVKTIKILTSLGNDYINLISYIISLFAFILGMYFILYKPISKRDERKKQKSDYIWGGIFIIGAILVIISIIF